MAKKLLLDVLLKVLGEFIELNEDNLDLSLAVWSGHIALKDLKLKAHKLLRNFDLSILHGEIKTLEVTIPWTALLNSPVKVLIDGVNLQMGPLNVAALDKEETKKRVISAKMQKLKMVDRLIDYPSGAIGSELDKDEAANSNDDPDKVKKPAPHARATYVQQWTSKIIDNIEITLKNVHIRYEDSQTIPSCPFSSGLTLSSFTLSTCDENWHEKFVARDINKQSSSIRKIAKVCSFGLYWSTKSVVLSKESFRDWSTKMQVMIYPGNIDAPQKASFDNVEYILHPANNLVVRLIHNELTDKMKPKFDMTVESTNLVLKIDRLQYLQLLRTMEMIGVTERQRQPHMYRPYERPSNPQNARAWWRYACKMVIKRGRYINLVKLSKSVSDEYGIVDMRTADEKNEARQLEQRMPLRSLVMFRHFAAKEMHDDLRKRRLELKRNSILKGYDATVQGAGKGQRTWVRWLAGIEATAAVISNSTDEGDVGVVENAESPNKGKIQNLRELEGDVSIASIISSLEKEGETAVDVSSKAVLFRLTLTTSASLDMAVAGMPVASATMALTTLAEITTWGVTATVNMRDVQVLDMCTDTPAMKNIIAVRQQCTEPCSAVTAEDPDLQDTVKDSSDQIFSVIYENLNNRTVVRISALPLEISLNKLCVQRLIGMFLAPSSLNATARTSALKTARNKYSKAMKSAQRPASVRKVTVPVPVVGMAGTTKKVPRSFFIDGLHAGSDDVDFKFRVIDDVEGDAVEELGGKDVEANKKEGQGQRPEELNGQDESGHKKTDSAPVHDRDNDLEIVFEAQAPKIIVHLDSSSDRGYLLLDTGYLTVRGLLNSMGMSWNVSLKEVNASMPHSVKDMYSSSVKSLYLIKPFHIAAKVQTTDTSTADMTVDVCVSPEVRGELDTVKLTRLLQVLPVITATFTRANCLASVSRAEEVLHLGASSVQPSLLPSLTGHPSSASLSPYTPLVSSSSPTSYSTPYPPPPLLSPSPSYSTPSLPPPPTPSSSLTPTSQPGTAEDIKNSYLSPLRKTLSEVEESESFRTPPESPPTYNLTEVRHLKIQTVSEEDLDIVDEIIADSQSILLEGRHVEVEVVDPSHVTMVINVKISEVALDLSYDVSKGRHVVLALHMLDIRVLFRPYDTQILFDLSELSIQDSLRSESQRDLARTPQGEKRLIHVSYISISKPESPFYGRHATEVMVEFSTLELNLDKNTVMHLRPFMEVLLAKAPAPAPPLPVPLPLFAPAPAPALTPSAAPIPPPPTPPFHPLETLLPPINRQKIDMKSEKNEAYDNSKNEKENGILSVNKDGKGSESVSTKDKEDRILKSGILKGMYITITVRNVSLDLLRVPTADTEGTTLANAFSLQITDLRACIDITDLVKADVKLRSFDIIDTRNISVDYVFKKVFCPVVNMDASVASWSSSASSNIDKQKDKQKVNDKEKIKGKEKEMEKDRSNDKIRNKGKDNSSDITLKNSHESKNDLNTTENTTEEDNDVLPDLLHVTYTQISTLTSMIDVSVLNIASFVSTDTILDLSFVAMDNFFSIMDLIAAPPIPPPCLCPAPAPTSTPTAVTPHPAVQELSGSDPLHPVLPVPSSPILTPLISTSTPLFAVPPLSIPPLPSTTTASITKTSSNITGEAPKNPVSSLQPPSLSLSSSTPISPPNASSLFALSDETSPLVCTSPLPVARTSNQHTPNTPQTPHTPLPHNTPHTPKALQHTTTVPHSHIILQPDGTSTMMNVVVRVTNPRLILLEDPTTDESRAIVGSCDIEVHYSRENRYSSGISIITKAQNRELRESLHVSVHNHEVFVLRSMLAWHPQPIVEPMGMELNLRRRTVNSVLLSSSLSVDVDNVYARVSINDILLAQSIMTRRTLTEPLNASSTASASITSTSSSTSKSSLSNTSVRRLKKQQGIPEGVGAGAEVAAAVAVTGGTGDEEPPTPSYTYSLNMGSLSLVGINDFNGQNMPVIRALLDGTTFFAEGAHQKMIGKGSLIASTYFYNPRLSLWESIMDRWHPSLSLTSWALGWGVEIKSEHTMQLTVSGIMLQSLLQTYSLFFRTNDIVDREEVSDVFIVNTLGSGIELDIYDSATGVLIMDLKGYDSKPVPRLQIPGKKRNLNGPVRNIPSVVDVYFSAGVERLPLHHVPFNINKPRAYNLHPHVLNDVVEYDSISGEKISVPQSPPIILEPIEEEVFENARYDLIIGRWRPPFFFGDPFEWTDASGTVHREIQGIQLHSDKWEWAGPWTVDMEAVVGDEVDKDGWEYATNFSSFSIASKRRSSRAMDCVRRRRWLRSRIPTAGSVDKRFRPLTVFWDVQVLQSGTRRVDVRSGLKIQNLMPFPIMVSFSGPAWVGTLDFGPFTENEIFNVPLLHACASSIRVQPACLMYEWSEAVACNLRMYDFSSSKDIRCLAKRIETQGAEKGLVPETEKGTGTGTGTGSGPRQDQREESKSNSCMRVLCRQMSKSFEVLLVPLISIANRLPCDLKFSCHSKTDDPKREVKGEVRSLLAGSECKLFDVSLTCVLKISFYLEGKRWSHPVTVNPSTVDPVYVQMFNQEGIVDAVLTMGVKLSGSTGAVEISVYSKGMILNRTGGLNICVRANKGRTGTGDVLTRGTCKHVVSTDTAVIQRGVVKPFDGLSEKQRRKAAVRAAGKLAGHSRKSSIFHDIDSPPLNATATHSDVNVSSDAVTEEKGGVKLLPVVLVGGDRVPGSEVVAVTVAAADTSLQSASKTTLQMENSDVKASSLKTRPDTVPVPVPAPVLLSKSASISASSHIPVPSHDIVTVPISIDDDDDYTYSDSDTDSDSENEEESGVSSHSQISSKLSRDVTELSDVTQTPLHITDLSIDSTRLYEVVRAAVGQAVYTDKGHKWTYLPHQLSGQMSIRTPWDDRMTRSKNLLQFNVSCPCLVLTLFDMIAISSPPKWIIEDGFHRVGDQATAYTVTNGTAQETFYGIYGRYYGIGETVSLKGAWRKVSHSMYSVFVIPALAEIEILDPSIPENSTSLTRNNGEKSTVRKYYDEITFNETFHRLHGSNSWVEGGNDVSLFHTTEDILSIGVQSSEYTVWSEDFSVDMVTCAHTGSFEVLDWETMKAYQLTYTVSQMPGVYSNTQLLTVVPRYCIVNCLDECLLVAQRGSKELLRVASYQAQGWHKSKSSLSTTVQLRCTSSFWSLGCVDLNEVGRSVIHLPRKDRVANEPPLVVVVEVKIAEPSDHCSVVIVIWQATLSSHAALIIHNDSEIPVTVQQADIEAEYTGIDKSHFEIRVAPFQRSLFGWADPDLSGDILVTAGSSSTGYKLRTARLNFLETGKQLRLPDNSGRIGCQGEVVLSVLAEGEGRVLHISRSATLSSSSSDNENFIGVPSLYDDQSTTLGGVRSFGLSLRLASFGLSLVIERPVRREFLSLYIDGLEGRVKTKGSIRSFEFTVMDLQIDNYSETAVYPVLLHSTKKEVHKSVDLFQTDEGANDEFEITDHRQPFGSASLHEVPLLQITLIEEMQSKGSGSGSSSVLKYVAMRLLPVAVEVDSATLQLLYADLITELKFVDQDQSAATATPTDWMDRLNKRFLNPINRNRIVDVYRSQQTAQARKMHIEKLIIHPMKIILTFIQTPFPRKTEGNTFQTTALNMLASLAGVDRMQIRLKSFEVDDILESRASVIGLIVNKTLQDLHSQLAQIAGSLSVIGSPIGFARKVGSGVKSFFYEPYQGAVLGPQDFVVGLGRGTTHLLANVVSGAMNSTVAIVGTASTGISLLSGDAEYVRKRAIKRQRNRANRGGIVDGILDGSESLISGITSGIGGLVTKPFEEARKNGVEGFFKGLGLGLMGAAVKPVMGITDGLTSVASGVSNQVDVATVHVPVRPARAFERSTSDNSDLVIMPLQLEAAFAQAFVLKRAKANSYEDTFLSYIPMDTQNPGEALILSETYVYWRKPKSLWGRTWANISHCYFDGDTVGIVLYGGDATTVTIPCNNRLAALRVYSALVRDSNRMGCPSYIIPVSLLLQESDTLTDIGRKNFQERQIQARSLAGFTDGYRFGTANSVRLRSITGPESDVLRRANSRMEAGYDSWKELDESVWRLIWEWTCTHTGLTVSRCCATVIINRSLSPLQISRVQMVHGKNVLLLGSTATGYEVESRVIMPGGSVAVFIWAFSPSPIEIGHLEAQINTAAFVAVIASTQRETLCEAKGGFTVGFYEKSVSSLWSKYVLFVS